MSRGPRFTDPRGDAQDEIVFHLEMYARELREQGMDEEEAASAARRRFGDVDRLLAECRRLDRRMARHWRRLDLWHELGTDLKLGLRRMIASPGFSLVALVTLALGIGATTALYSVLHAVVLRPLPYENPDRLVVLTSENRERDFDGMPLPPGAFHHFQQLESLEPLGAYRSERLTLLGEAEPRRVTGAGVTANLLEVLGREPVLGRGLLADDPAEGGDRVCLVSDSLWRSHFAARAEAIGERLRFAEGACQVVGVLPRALEYPGSLLGQAEVWLPLSLENEKEEFSSWYLEGLARLGPGVTLGAAQSELDGASRALADRLPFGDGWHFRLDRFDEQVIGNVRPALLVLFAAVMLVLLIACVNLAHLLIARTAERSREMQVRAALGASRVRLIRQVLVEHAALAAAGGALGLGLARVLMQVLLRLGAADLPRVDGIALSAPVVGFALFATLVAAVLSGVLPARQAGRSGRWHDALRTPGIPGGHRTTLRSLLVVAEVALAMVLLVGAGLLLRSFDRLLAVEPGFDAGESLTMTIERPRGSSSEPEQWRSFFEELDVRVAALPMVSEAGLISALPGRGSFMIDQLSVEGDVSGTESDDPRPSLAIDVVSPSAFRALGVPLLRGRFFDPRDRAGTEPAVIVNESLARRFFPGESAVGRRILGSDDENWWTIVGVVGDVKENGPRNETLLHAYLPQSQHPPRRMSLVVRCRVDPLELAPQIKAIVHEIDPVQPITDVSTLEDVLAESVARDRFNVVLMSAFALLAVLLATLGVYGVIAYSVSRRRREMGVRTALGADRGDLFWMVLRWGLALTGIGALIGLAGSLMLGRFLEGLLFGVGPSDPLVLGGITLSVFAIALVACVGPARRATRVEPSTALRSD